RGDASLVTYYASPFMPRRLELSLITLILLIAAFLRLFRLGDLPPGWRDDEVVETTVHAQIVLEGRFPLFFPQAEGHEPLYHYLSAALIALAGRSLFSVRLLSVFFGLFSLAALYRFARRYFGSSTALLATAALGLSFWGLMYSRFKLRHVSEVGLMLLAFYFFLRPLAVSKPLAISHQLSATLAGLCLSLCLYTYFAARVAPLILLAFVVYLALFHRPLFQTHWRNFALTFVVASLLSAPLAWAIAEGTPGGEERLSVVGQPLQELLRGNFSYAWQNTVETLGMFAITGDPESLYNIPHRPVFEWVGAALFLAGVLLSARRWRQPRYAFLLIWLIGGLAPAFVSIPSASLG
ncbi:MAG: glycosyltransferase family 39 protein, partial [Chloroflexi bacterium]|nr:glycosyltransferase family 39 protein [Chloroflexota bacterium]